MRTVVNKTTYNRPIVTHVQHIRNQFELSLSTYILVLLNLRAFSKKRLYAYKIAQTTIE